jgi:hypothetical protein
LVVVVEVLVLETTTRNNLPVVVEVFDGLEMSR